MVGNDERSWRNCSLADSTDPDVEPETGALRPQAGEKNDAPVMRFSRRKKYQGQPQTDQSKNNVGQNYSNCPNYSKRVSHDNFRMFL